jgi:hypothetical protein
MKKSIVPYPRDMISAYNALLATAKYGILSDSQRSSRASAAESRATDKQPGGLMPMFRGSSAFTKVTATTPDGTKFSASVENEGVVIDSEDGES